MKSTRTIIIFLTEFKITKKLQTGHDTDQFFETPTNPTRSRQSSIKCSLFKPKKKNPNKHRRGSKTFSRQAISNGWEEAGSPSRLSPLEQHINTFKQVVFKIFNSTFTSRIDRQPQVCLVHTCRGTRDQLTSALNIIKIVVNCSQFTCHLI